MVFNATFNTFLVISWWSVLLVKETGVPGENNQLASNHWQTLSYNVENMAGTSRHEWDSNYNYLVILFISIYGHNLMFHFILHTWISGAVSRYSSLNVSNRLTSWYFLHHICDVANFVSVVNPPSATLKSPCVFQCFMSLFCNCNQRGIHVFQYIYQLLIC